MNKIAMLIASTTILMGSSYTTSEQEHLVKYPYESFQKVMAWDAEIHKHKINTIQNKQVDEFDAIITCYTIDEGDKTPDDPEYGITASMKKGVPYSTIAMDRKFPFGTIVEIDGFDHPFVCEDRGGAIRHNHIDMLVRTSREADDWGRRVRKVRIIKMGEGIKGESR